MCGAAECSGQLRENLYTEFKMERILNIPYCRTAKGGLRRRTTNINRQTNKQMQPEKSLL
jgi:hypothetical protein